jgi:CPA1 family monovalent cation:H+ antiporter
MRGLVTLATAFALPGDFPQRDLIVLTAFAVVLATLVLQGLTLGPLIRLLRLDGDDGLDRELERARAIMANVALDTIGDRKGPVADYLRFGYRLALKTAQAGRSEAHEKKRRLGLTAIARQRDRLDAMRNDGEVGADSYLILQEELDFRELAMATEDERHIEES